MSTRERPADRGRRLAEADRRRAGTEIRTARTILGWSIERVARSAALSPSQVGRLERGALPSASIDQLGRLGAAVGLDVRLRCYPGPDVPRDSGQLGVASRFRTRIHPGLVVRSEVPLPMSGDQRAWDQVVSGFVGGGEPLPVEFETRLADVQAQARRIRLKLRDSGMSSVLLVVADTRANRRALALAGQGLAAEFPISARTALAMLALGRHPGGSSIIRL